eukprot:CAMPEP_0113312854 /NCGR_PEP_ID=MMETSP0010_2-20120614/9519_1 /TAXON_ID=216773 ORGANISM="Corethron hystrix, Strain 308" /NCGR_SAMPLE_ID=MMETSP0010_2 /ASSEMBLY_ACC=CAM_ASM_000155 /LENGTH=128 /DNA_ID=CAMNT_0000168765 /DNA_START=138 /DNA_END=525 /DNA_ORIENTATION=+ /assembly_acc=CAM_ASM_000155
MAKSIRSKSKRRNRTEFRNTIGKKADEENMAKIQQKLAQCIGTGRDTGESSASFSRISSLLNPSSTASIAAVDNDGDVEMDTAVAETSPTVAVDDKESPTPDTSAQNARTNKKKRKKFIGAIAINLGQ